MKRAGLVAIVMVGIMISSSFMVLESAEGSAVLPISLPYSLHVKSTPATVNKTAFTLYVPSSAFSRAVIKEELVNHGIMPQTIGNLWTFSVPYFYSGGVASLLRNISSQFHTSFFSSNKMSIALPTVQTAGISQSSTIPFAYTPSLISRAYNFTWAFNQGINGKGQTIVIVDAYGDPNIAYDLKAFDAVNGLPPLDLKIIYPYGTPGQYNSTWAMETATDVEWAHALAPAAKIVLLVSTSAYTDYLQQLVSYAVENRVGGILSLSWGTPESQLTASAVATYSKIYNQAASDGIDIFAASGDQGAYAGTSELTVSYPASDPLVTGVGGTSLYVLNNQFHEYGWGGLNNGQSYGSGGGYSTYFRTPYWQSAQGYNGSMRGVPDVSMDADKYTGVYVISNGGQYTVGGTSVSTPMWADVAALIRQYTNNSLPSLNPLLYQLARSNLYNSSFNQILTGTNGHYKNGPGWNPVTGLGTPKVSGLLNDSRKLLDGYGGVAKFNGENNFNATSVRADLNVSITSGNLDRNGSTLYYIGFYDNSGNYVKFGVLLNSTGERLMLELAQNNVSVVRFFNMPSPYTGGISAFSMELHYSGTSITASTSGSFTTTLPAFLDFSGNMVPSAGVQQISSETNLTKINSGTFYGIQTSRGSTWNNVTNIFFQQYNHIGSSTYSTIVSSKFTDNALHFYSSSSTPQTYLNGSKTVPPEISYNLTYGDPIVAEFNVSGASSSVSWSVNGTALASQFFTVPKTGGTYIVNATFTNVYDTVVTVSRVFSMPGILETNVSVNYSIPGYSMIPQTTVTTMWFYNYTYNSVKAIPILNSTYSVRAEASGFYSYDGQKTPSANLTLKLQPRPLNLTVFVFNVNSTVLVNNVSLKGHNGYYYQEIYPTPTLWINATAPGFLDSNFTYSVSPGENISDQVTLMPVNLNSSIISGTVSDFLYAFPVTDSLVRLGNISSSYTNVSGNYILFSDPGKFTVNASAPLYDPYSSPLNVTANTILNIQLKPAKIALQTTALVNITHYFPLLFYLGFISWNDYKGANFSLYQIYVSEQSDFLNPSVTTVSSQNTSYTFLTGIVPGHTYYISVVLRLSNAQVYQSQVVKISYTDPVYLTINIILLGAIVFYGYIAYRVFRKKN